MSDDMDSIKAEMVGRGSAYAEPLSEQVATHMVELQLSALKDECERLRAVLAWYADPDNCRVELVSMESSAPCLVYVHARCPVVEDQGERARKALERTE